MINPEINRKLISARYVNSFKLFLANLPTVIFSLALQEFRLADAKLFWLWSLASVIGTLLTLVFYISAYLLYFRKYKNSFVPLWTVSLFGLFIGIIKGLGTSIAALQFNLLDPDPLNEILFRTFNAALIGLVFFPLMLKLANSYFTFTVTRKNLIEQKLTLEYSRIENENLAAELKSNLSKKIDSNLVLILQDAKLHLGKSSKIEFEWEQIALILRQTALSAVRPLSHELWNNKNEFTTRFFDRFRFIFPTMRFDNFTWIILYTVTVLPYLLENGKSSAAILNMAFRIILLYICVTSMELLKLVSQSKRRYFFLTNILFFCGVQFIGTWQINNITGFSNSLLGIVDLIWIASLIIITGIAETGFKTQEYEIEDLQNLVTQEQIEEMAMKNEVARFSRDIAKYLHGTLQSRLMASAMSIENAGRKGDKELLKNELNLAIANLELPPIGYFAHINHGSEFNVREIISKWDGILNVRISISRNLKKHSIESSKNIVDILEEALINAHRHGEATEISIDIYLNTDEKIEIEIRDNGNGPKEGKQGMGSQLFASLSDDWSLSKSKKSNGAVLIIALR